MSTIGFLAELRGLGIKLWLEGGRLRCKAAVGVLNPELKAQLAVQKENIISFLHDAQESAGSTTRLLSRLRSLGVRLWMDDEVLRCKAAPGVLTAKLKEELKQNKPAIIRFLQNAKSGANQGPPLPRAAQEPISPEQARLWLLYQLLPEGTVLHRSFAMRWNGRLQKDHLKRALQALVQRHPSLRNSFPTVNGKPQLVTQGETRLAFAKINLKEGSEQQRELSMREGLLVEAGRPFDMAVGPLFRATLFLLDENKYVVLLTLHRLIADQCSLQILVRELALFYELLTSGEEPTLPSLFEKYKLCYQYGRQWEKSKTREKQLAYWREKLEGWPLVFDLPFDRPRREVLHFNSAKHIIEFSAEQNERLQSNNLKPGVVPFHYMFTVYTVLLFRYSGHEHFLVASPYANRGPEKTGLVGQYANTVPLQANLAGNPCFAALLERVAVIISGAHENADIPLQQLSRELLQEPDLSRNPICQVKFVLNETIDWELRTGDSTVSPLPLDLGIANNDLCLRIEEDAGGIKAEFEYNTDLFDETTIARMDGHFLNLLDGCLAWPERPVAELPMLNERELQQLLVTFNDTNKSYPRNKCLHELFAEQVARTPDLVAISLGEVEHTYRQLNQKANRLGAYLKKRGIGPEVIVGIYTEPSVEMIFALLGVLKAGGGCLPLQPNSPKEGLALMLEEAGVNMVLTQQHLASEFTEKELECLELDASVSHFRDEKTDNIESPGRADLAAFIIYTPLPTGGIKTSHRVLVNRLLWMQETYQLEQTDRVLQRTPFSSGSAINEIFWPLTAGARVVLTSPSGQQGYPDLARQIIDEGITHLQLVPFGLKKFLAEPQAGKCSSIKRVLCGAEALSAKLVNRFHQVLKGAQLDNLYGAKEVGGEVTSWACTPTDRQSIAPIGRPIHNTKTYILDARQNPVPIGVAGGLFISAEHQVNGYLSGKDSDSFIANPFSSESDNQLFRTGDRARYLPDGNIECFGRADRQVKVHGLRVNLEEIEAAIDKHTTVRQSVVTFCQDAKGVARLVAYFISDQQKPPGINSFSEFLKKSLPKQIIPAAFVRVDVLPLTSEGKIDESLLPMPKEFKQVDESFPRGYTEVEREIAKAWREVLHLETVDVHEDFFDLDGDSLLLAEVYHKLPQILQRHLEMVDLFRFANIHDLALYLEKEEQNIASSSPLTNQQDEIQQRCEEIRQMPGINIAVIGLSGRFPGAENMNQFWENLRNGVESITFFSKQELLAEGVEAELLEDPDYVKAQGTIDIKGFDAPFFDFTPREAQITDPQHRIFLECAWEALEDAGYSPDNCGGDVGVFGGSCENLYYEENIKTNPGLWQSVGSFPIAVGNDKDYLCTRVSYKLGLTGPGVALQSACTTSLLAVHTACLNLLSKDCRMAIAGGVSTGYWLRAGYLYEPGMLLSPDGHCRPFDVAGEGTVPAQGCALVVLKRLEDAVVDGDFIYGVIRSSATNNDGNAKRANFAAPGLEGQPDVLEKAHRAAAVDPETITYIETSSTGSAMGDPIEIGSLKRAFAKRTNLRNFCALGGLKANIGILDQASGSAALVKALLALKHRELPPNIHFQTANPKLDLANSPFFVNNKLIKWEPEDGGPLRAGVSSFGLGGTNAHLVLEEAPKLAASVRHRPEMLVTLSARTETALETMTTNFSNFLRDNSHLNFSDACYTLHVGRKDFKYRRMLVSHNLHDTVLKLRKMTERVFTKVAKTHSRPLCFMFPGQGMQYQNMGRQLYQVEPGYREQVDRCWKMIETHAPSLYNSITERDRGSRSEKIHETFVTQPATFITEYALAKLLMKWGIQPDAMIGNSLGEYVAACLAGVFSLEDALNMVSTRGRLMQGLPPGSQLAVLLSEDAVAPFLNHQLSIAGIAGPQQTMISGSKTAISELKALLEEQSIECYRLFASHAFHSYMMDPILEEFTQVVSTIKLHPPQIPIISTITGAWLSDREATDPNYWARQFRQPVRFSQGLELLFQEKERIFLEVGPDKQLSTIAIRHPAKTREHQVLATMRQPLEEVSDFQQLITTLGRLWLGGLKIDWDGFYSKRRYRRLPLPTYPFEKKDHWIDAPKRKYVTQEMDLEADELDADEDEGNEDHYRPNVSNDFVAPRDNDEVVVARFWCDALGLAEIGVFDDFFELGGSSLVAVRLVNLLRKNFEVPLSNTVLLQKRSIAAVTEFIKENRALSGAVNTSMAELQPGKKGVRPLFLFHPIEGDLFAYRQIVDYLGPRQPVYGLQAKSLLGEEPFSDMKVQASAYLAEMRKVQGEPPYLLAGFSYGGLLAYEIACQLGAKGEQVPLLALIDSAHPKYIKERLENPVSILDFLSGYALNFPENEYRELNFEEQIAYAEDKARAANRPELIPPGFGVEMCRTWLGHQEAIFGYKPDPYPGRMIFFRATELMGDELPNSYLPWLDLVKGGVEIHQIPGNHITIMNTTAVVKIIAKNLKQAMRGL